MLSKESATRLHYILPSRSFILMTNGMQHISYNRGSKIKGDEYINRLQIIKQCFSFFVSFVSWKSAFFLPLRPGKPSWPASPGGPGNPIGPGRPRKDERDVKFG